MAPIGYEFLRQSLALQAFPPARPAFIKPVTRIEQTEDALAVPKHVAPNTDDPVAHLLFALKHEGTNLQILAEAMPRVDPAALTAEIRRAPSGAYTRLAGYLWEQFNKQQLPNLPEISGPTVDLFDPQRYVTGRRERNARWRVAFNGLGSLGYCATVERTPYIQNAIKADILGRANDFIASLGKNVIERALSWAYLHETKSSYAIERETPSEEKSRMFVALLHQAHDKKQLTEEYLVDLQNTAISNPYLRDASFRREQNHLSGPLRGAAGVTYVPPPPAMVPELMEHLMTLGNTAPHTIDPIIAASIVSFGFVYIHPFMDGNGRLSRFLFHQALCQSGRLEKGLLLPVSVAMSRHEDEYLDVLQQYSKPARERWDVTWIEGNDYEFRFNGDPGMYRYWDATACVEFGFRMAEQALETELREETIYLARYDQVVKEVGERFDVRSSDLAVLVRSVLDNNGKLSNNRRKQFADRVNPDAFDFIEQCAQEALGLAAGNAAEYMAARHYEPQPIKKGATYLGEVRWTDGKQAVQAIGRSQVILHDVSTWSLKPHVGDSMSVCYGDDGPIIDIEPPSRDRNGRPRA